MLKVVFFGCTKFSELILKGLQKEGLVDIKAIFTIPKNFNISYNKEPVKNSNYSDLSKIVDNLIEVHKVNSIKGQRISDYYKVIESINPDIILVMGWYFMVPKKIRELAKYGAWGIHASLLPDYAGGAPLVWAIIEGQEKTGVTLFRLDDGVDDGDIIAQKEIQIAPEDSIKEVYEKATNASHEILSNTLLNFDNITFTKQDKSKIKVYPQRSPQDGEIDLTLSAKKIYNFIRAQSFPYPGAFIKTTDGRKIIIDKARIENV